MAESAQLENRVQSRIDTFVSTRETILAGIGGELAPLVAYSRQFLSGGKRFRASFCYWGWRSVATGEVATGEVATGGAPIGNVATGSVDSELLNPDARDSDMPDEVVSVASALEIFHAAALVHDDIMDNSDTRRGAPSMHRLLEALHGERGWVGDAREFGNSSALLLGDLLLGWSDELLDEGLDELADRAAAKAARVQFNQMRTEVTAGQYLDIREEQAWAQQPEAAQLDSALRVITYKSAKYSVQAPLLIGACLAGANHDQVDALRRFGLPLGIAFQLRDDVLGVFGDPAVTGKPSGDDLREGKRTVLIALARQRLSATGRDTLDALLGDSLLEPEQIAALQESIRGSGAVDEVERMIAGNVAEAEHALEGAPLTDAGLARLHQLTDTATRRSA